MTSSADVIVGRRKPWVYLCAVPMSIYWMLQWMLQPMGEIPTSLYFLYVLLIYSTCHTGGLGRRRRVQSLGGKGERGVREIERERNFVFALNISIHVFFSTAHTFSHTRTRARAHTQCKQSPIAHSYLMSPSLTIPAHRSPLGCRVSLTRTHAHTHVYSRTRTHIDSLTCAYRWTNFVSLSFSQTIYSHTLSILLSPSLSLFIFLSPFLSLFFTDRRLFTVANSADDWVHEPIPNFAKDHDRSHVRRWDLQMTSCVCVCVYTYICVYIYVCIYIYIVCEREKSAYEGERVNARMRTRESVSLRVTMRVIHLSDLEEERL